jgi:hypothetical protein
MENILADLPSDFPEEFSGSILSGNKRRLRALEGAEQE